MGNSSINLGLPERPLTDDNKLFLELLPIYNALKNILHAHDAVTGIISPPESDWPQLKTNRFTTGGMHKIYVTAFENLSLGNTVGIYNDAGVGKAKKAQDGVLEAIGFCSAPNGTTAGAVTEITVVGRYPLFPASTLTPGAKYYQSATPGVIGVSGTGTQVIGFAVSDTELIWMPQL